MQAVRNLRFHDRPLVIFLPAYGPRGAALLRIYNVAAALRGRGWRSLVLPSSLTLDQRHRLIASMRPDLIVMQGARHALNRPELYPGQRIIYDMDDADFHLPHLAEHVAQAMPVVAGVISGSRYIANWCRGRGARADVVWSGTRLSRHAPVAHIRRGAVVAWAQTAPATYVSEAEWVLDIMGRLARRVPEVRLCLYDRKSHDGPEFIERFQAAGIRTEWVGSAKYSDYLASFDSVAVGLAPLSLDAPFTRGKSFGKVLGYLDRRVPVIASDAGQHDQFFDRSCGVMSNDADVWVDALEHLLNTPRDRQSMADTAFTRLRRHMSLAATSQQVDACLRNYLEKS